MTNKEIALAFIHRYEAYNLNLRTDGNKLMSYNTCIAQFLPNGALVVNRTYYSNTTSRHLNMVLRKMKPVREFYDIPIGTQYLIDV